MMHFTGLFIPWLIFMGELLLNDFDCSCRCILYTYFQYCVGVGAVANDIVEETTLSTFSILRL